jgi:hypothetical protein
MISALNLNRYRLTAFVQDTRSGKWPASGVFLSLALSAHLVIENLVLRASRRSRIAGVKFNGFASKTCPAVLEYWSFGVTENPQ